NAPYSRAAWRIALPSIRTGEDRHFVTSVLIHLLDSPVARHSPVLENLGPQIVGSLSRRVVIHFRPQGVGIAHRPHQRRLHPFVAKDGDPRPLVNDPMSRSCPST